MIRRGTPDAFQKIRLMRWVRDGRGHYVLSFTARSEITPYHGVYIKIVVCIILLYRQPMLNVLHEIQNIHITAGTR